MITTLALTPKQALNKAFLKIPTGRNEIENFKKSLNQLAEQMNPSESEEYNKNLISNFLKHIHYADRNFINTKGRSDLVIHNGKAPDSSAGVILEVKSPTNKSEMASPNKLNCKAFQELLLYYLRERIFGKNLEIRHLILTNIKEWFIFDSNIFEVEFANDKKLVSQFQAFEAGGLSGKNTEFFYKEIAEPAIEAFVQRLTNKGKPFYTYFELQDYKVIRRADGLADYSKLIALYKILSPQHLLKTPFQNDSNSLDKDFYTEYLHIIGLTEVESGSKKIIRRKGNSLASDGSILENTIAQLEGLDKISRLPSPKVFGVNVDEQTFNVALELVITWVNRILFLKLLEAQIISYNGGDKEFSFLNTKKITNFDDLNELFFQVLARERGSRIGSAKENFINVPYLNSSLFEPTELEHTCLFISQLQDGKEIELFPGTILKDSKGKRRVGKLNAIEYLFEFLDAYNFGSEGSNAIQEENKRLINASVLGLIFEKINGYKDGSFFTPGYITMHMCRETIRAAVIEKFNYVYQWECKSLDEIYNKIEDKVSANLVINGLKICDPAVGSGHYLVSALNELLSIKSYLGILTDKDGRTLRDYQLEVINDELIITDGNGELFEYNHKNRESQRVQETLFHEKQTLIENCLFGVDLNPNSVKICRLRLWIELLKHAYYRNNDGQDLETLPNIDINIKCGNSLIRRFSLDANLQGALKKSKITIKSYREAIRDYQHARDKTQKRSMEQVINEIKGDFRTEISAFDPRLIKLNKLEYKLNQLGGSAQLFELSRKEKTGLAKERQKIEADAIKLAAELETVKNNAIYENAFEWRFEFPEILDESGNFIGFDVIIANPPYIPLEALSSSERNYYREKYPQFHRKFDTSVLFIAEGFALINSSGVMSFIAPATWQTGENYVSFRKALIADKTISRIINLPFNTFEDAYVDTSIYFLSRRPTQSYQIYSFEKKDKRSSLNDIPFANISFDLITEPQFKIILDEASNKLSARFSSSKFTKLGTITKSTQGLSGSRFPASTLSSSESVYPFLAKGNAYNYTLVKEHLYQTDLSDKPSLKQFYEAGPKLLIRRIISRQDRLTVGYTEEKLVFKKDVNPFIVTDQKYDPKFLLGVMASSLISYLYLNLSTVAKKDDFRQTTLGELRNLPIPDIDERDQQQVISLVTKILEKKSLDPFADTSKLEEMIDQEIFKLYDLSEEEVATVKFKMVM